ncbi:MAG: phosphorylase family protein [Candidatus Wenzhouxiangella sp. M2_3B_020]
MFLAALAWEARTLSSEVPEPSLLISGPGPAAARSCAERAIEAGADLLVSWGTAGAIGCAEPGDVVLATSVLGPHGRSLACSEAESARLAPALDRIARVHRVPIAGVDAPVCSVAGKRALAERTGAMAVDMESAAIVAAAARAGIGVLVLRVILDRADQPVPPAAIAAMDGTRVRPGRVLASLLESPRQLGALGSLARSARRARKTLEACARIVPAAVIGNR